MDRSKTTVFWKDGFSYRKVTSIQKIDDMHSIGAMVTVAFLEGPGVSYIPLWNAKIEDFHFFNPA